MQLARLRAHRVKREGTRKGLSQPGLSLYLSGIKHLCMNGSVDVSSTQCAVRSFVHDDPQVRCVKKAAVSHGPAMAPSWRRGERGAGKMARRGLCGLGLPAGATGSRPGPLRGPARAAPATLKAEVPAAGGDGDSGSLRRQAPGESDFRTAAVALPSVPPTPRNLEVPRDAEWQWAAH